MPFTGGVNPITGERHAGSRRNFNDYLSLTPQKNTEMYALAYYNLAYIAFHKKDYANGARPFPEVHPTEKGRRHNRSCRCVQPCRRRYMHVRRFDEAKQYYTRAENLGTPAGDYSYYQLALVSGLQKTTMERLRC